MKEAGSNLVYMFTSIPQHYLTYNLCSKHHRPVTVWFTGVKHVVLVGRGNSEILVRWEILLQMTEGLPQMK